MRLCTLAVEHPRDEGERRDGRLAVVHPDGGSAAPVPGELWATLRGALEEWTAAEPKLRALEAELAAGRRRDAVELSSARLLAPLPRTWAWLDGSAFISHINLVRKARGAEPPEDLKTVPLMYQGVSDNLLGPHDDIPLLHEAHGMDFESEVAVVLDDVPLGTKAAEAERHVKLLMLMNDVSLRNLIPRELKAGFGFFHGKPASSFSPFAATPDELGAAWREGRVHAELSTTLNGRLFGHPDAGEMFFSFPQLIEHAARTRALPAGTILGSGTVSNEDPGRGSSCLAEQRMIEQLRDGHPSTPFLRAGDSVELEMLVEGRSVFGKISQRVVGPRVHA